MTNESSREARLDAYLWDPRSDPDPAVTSIERLLAAARFDPSRDPLSFPAPAPATRPGASGRRWRWAWVLAPAAAALLLAAGLSAWRWTWPAGREWTIEPVTPGAHGALVAGTTLRLAEDESAIVQVARIGTMRVEGGTVVSLLATSSNRHRLALEKGSVRVRVWAPPASVSFRTPAGDVIDLGCEFELTVDDQTSNARVLSGWVQLVNGLGESLIPAGALGELRAGVPPSVPVFEDAAPDFHRAVACVEREPGCPPDAIDRIVAQARQRDVLTLLMLVDRGAAGRDRLAARAAELWPPPGGVTVAGVLQGDRDALWRWHESLPLPPPKGWLRNWRDALPRWLGLQRRG